MEEVNKYMKNLFFSLRIVFSESLYRYIAVSVSLVVAYISYWLFYQTTTIPTFLENIRAGDFGPYSWAYGITYIITTLLTVGVSGVSVTYLVWLYKHSALNSKKSLGASASGLIASAFGMGCPVCGAFLFSAVGIAGGLSILPLQGLELKFASLGLMMGSTVFASRRVNEAADCQDCNDISGHNYKMAKINSNQSAQPKKNLVVLPLEKIFISLLVILFLFNQILMTQVSAGMGFGSKSSFIGSLFGIKTAAAATVIAPKLNPDGKTTTLVEQPTITEVPANPNTGDALADAKVVMLATGKPFYAPDDISFDDPVNAQKKWGAFETSIKLSADLEARYQKLIGTMVCSYCCGGPTNVTINKNCGCAHAKAVRGFYKYMLQTYGDKYSDEQLVGESHRWYAIWYPKGMLEDYLLATGKGDVLGHQTHGGAGTDGRHGL